MSATSPQFKLEVHHGGEFAYAILYRKDGSKPWHEVYTTTKGGENPGKRAAEAALNGYGVKFNADLTKASYKGHPSRLRVEVLDVPHRSGNPSKMVLASKTSMASMSTGTKVAIGAGAVAGVGGLVGLGIWWWKRRQAAAASAEPPPAPQARSGGGGGGSRASATTPGSGETMTASAPCPPGTRDDGQQCVPEGGFESNPLPDGYSTVKCEDCAKILLGSPAGFALCMATCDRGDAGGGDFGQIASGPDSERASVVRAELARKRCLWGF